MHLNEMTNYPNGRQLCIFGTKIVDTLTLFNIISINWLWTTPASAIAK